MCIRDSTACGLSIVLAMQQQRTERMLEESERKNHVLQEQLRSQQASTEAWVMVDATQDHGQDCSPRCSYSHVEHLMRRRAEETREMEACLLSMQQQLGETQFQLDQTERELAAQRTGRAELDLLRERLETQRMDLDLQLAMRNEPMAWEMSHALVLWLKSSCYQHMSNPPAVCVQRWKQAVHSSAYTKAFHLQRLKHAVAMDTTQSNAAMKISILKQQLCEAQEALQLRDTLSQDTPMSTPAQHRALPVSRSTAQKRQQQGGEHLKACLLYTSDAADEEDSVDLGGRRIIKKKKSTREMILCEE
eukprot:TRINITY_DN3112_c0_g1_i6.p1 TRINITY_DN3112_c0_g1~~TRINITY_DN3112_c0_g1_i6.p1  ORF type:complete len:305 (-),score=89.69 TRINITY_DN3112_c0_g1_i6:33-947(-)